MFSKLKKILTTALVSVTMLTSAFSLISNNNYADEKANADSDYNMILYLAPNPAFRSGVSNPTYKLEYRYGNEGTKLVSFSPYSTLYNGNQIYRLDANLYNPHGGAKELFIHCYAENGDWKSKALLQWDWLTVSALRDKFYCNLITISFAQTDSQGCYSAYIQSYTCDSKYERYFYYAHTNSYYNTYAYCWDAYGNNGSFRGNKISESIYGYDGIVPIYRYKYNRVTPYSNIIFADDSSQTNDLDCSGQDGKVFYPNSDGKSGEWKSLSSAFRTYANCQNHTVYFARHASFTNTPRIHLWNVDGSGNTICKGTTWPGELMTDTGSYFYGKKVYKYTYFSSVKYSNCKITDSTSSSDNDYTNHHTSDLSIPNSSTFSALYDLDYKKWITDPYNRYCTVNGTTSHKITVGDVTGYLLLTGLKKGDTLQFHRGSYSMRNYSSFDPSSTFYDNGCLSYSNGVTTVNCDGDYEYAFNFTYGNESIKCNTSTVKVGITAHNLAVSDNVRVGYKISFLPETKFKLVIYTDNTFATPKYTYLGTNTFNSGTGVAEETITGEETYSPQYYSEKIYAKCFAIYSDESELLLSTETYCINDYLTSMAEKNPTNKMYENMKTYGTIAANDSYVDTTGLADAISGSNSKRVYKFTTDLKAPKAISDLRIALGSSVTLSFKYDLSVYSELSKCSLYCKDGDTISLIGDKGVCSIDTFYSTFASTRQFFIGQSADISQAKSVFNINGYQFIYSALQSNQTTAHEKAVYIALYNFISTIGTN